MAPRPKLWLHSDPEGDVKAQFETLKKAAALEFDGNAETHRGRVDAINQYHAKQQYDDDDAVEIAAPVASAAPVSSAAPVVTAAPVVNAAPAQNAAPPSDSGEIRPAPRSTVPQTSDPFLAAARAETQRRRAIDERALKHFLDMGCSLDLKKEGQPPAKSLKGIQRCPGLRNPAQEDFFTLGPDPGLTKISPASQPLPRPINPEEASSEHRDSQQPPPMPVQSTPTETPSNNPNATVTTPPA